MMRKTTHAPPSRRATAFMPWWRAAVIVAMVLGLTGLLALAADDDDDVAADPPLVVDGIMVDGTEIAVDDHDAEPLADADETEADVESDVEMTNGELNAEPADNAGSDRPSPPSRVADVDDGMQQPVGAPIEPAEWVMMNFRQATLETILEYLSEQAGFIIVNNVQLEGRITVFNHQPMTRDEAVDLLNTVLKEQGFTAVRRERLLRIVRLEDAKRHSVPVRWGNDPEQIRQTDTMITQVIPIKYADAQAMARDLAPLASDSFAELTANRSSNSLIVTNTEANVRRIVEIARALDQSISQVKEVKVFRLRYANARETAALLSSIFRPSTTPEEQIGRAVTRRFGGRGGGGQQAPEEDGGAMARDVTTAADERTNSLVISAAPELMAVITTIITDLDSDNAAKEAVFTYHAKNASAAELETMLNSLFSGTTTGGGGGGGGGQGNRNQRRQQSDDATGSAADLVGNVTAVADVATNSLMVLTAEANFQRIRAILDDLDRPIPQVLVRVLIAELTHDRGIDLGVELGVNKTVGGDTVLEALTTFGNPALGLSFLVLDDDYTAAVHALETTGALNVLSRPYILTGDNQDASILVGEEFPFITNTRVTDEGTTINTIQYRDIGIILNVTPHINEDGLVVLNVSQELSTVTDSTVQISENLNASRVAKRTAMTRIAVNDGRTVVIGGLMQDQLVSTVTKVPFFGDIPVLGELFKRTQETKAKTELVLFLTPEVVMDPADLAGVTRHVIDNEMENVKTTIEPGALQRHLDRMRGRDRSLDENHDAPRTDEAPSEP